MKYNVGDTVVIRNDLEDGEMYGGDEFVYPMSQYLGTKMTISKIVDGEYRMRGDKDEWNWTDEMIKEKSE